MNELTFVPVAYGWLVQAYDWSWFLNGDEGHQNEPVVLASDKDGWKIKFKNLTITINYAGSVHNIHVH